MKASELVPIEANENIPDFGPGDTVRVNFRIREGNRERVQAFQGVCIRRTHGKGPAANFTVRRITAGIGIERVFPLHSPLIESLEVTRQGKVRRGQVVLPAWTPGPRRPHQGTHHLPQPVSPGGVSRTAARVHLARLRRFRLFWRCTRSSVVGIEP